MIPVHSLTRPLARAVDSALAAAAPLGRERFVIIVVAHHLSVEQVGGMLSDAQRAQVEIIDCPDEGSTAGVPRTTALERTTATYISFIDSDDTLDPGSVARWVEMAERYGSDLIIPALFHHAVDRTDVTPLTRPGRSKKLDPVADRLVYRGSVFGLNRVSAVRRIDARFDCVTATAEDLAFAVKLYAFAGRIDYAAGFPAYVVHDDPMDRVSRKPVSVRRQMEPAVNLCRKDWFTATDPAFRMAYALKFTRVNLFAVVENHLAAGTWSQEEARAATESLEVLFGSVPQGREQFSRADERVIKLLEAPSADPEQLRRALVARRRYATPAALLTPRLERLLAPNAPLRIYTAGVFQTLRYYWGVARRTRVRGAVYALSRQPARHHAQARREVSP